jgi:hypothetical protein
MPKDDPACYKKGILPVPKEDPACFVKEHPA